MPVLDTLRRPLGTLRLSITDRCNLRCHYCVPEADYICLPRRDILSFEEIGQLVDVFGEAGVDRIRLTGGEPLLRRDLPDLIARLSARPWLRDLAMTTNGVRLGELAAALRRAGLRRVTVSLDTLRRDRFQRLARADALPRVLDGISAARRAGFSDLKLNAVITRGDNDDELVDLIEFGGQEHAEVRFIEYMDVGGSSRWRADKVVTARQMLERLADRYGPIARLPETSPVPAARFRLPNGRTFGIIAATTQPFCRTCTRARLTADGVLFSCLHARSGIHLGQALRAGAPEDVLRDLVRTTWERRADRGAELQLIQRQRGDLVVAARCARGAHLEMRARGG